MFPPAAAVVADHGRDPPVARRRHVCGDVQAVWDAWPLWYAPANDAQGGGGGVCKGRSFPKIASQNSFKYRVTRMNFFGVGSLIRGEVESSPLLRPLNPQVYHAFCFGSTKNELWRGYFCKMSLLLSYCYHWSLVHTYIYISVAPIKACFPVYDSHVYCEEAAGPVHWVWVLAVTVWNLPFLEISPPKLIFALGYLKWVLGEGRV